MECQYKITNIFKKNISYIWLVSWFIGLLVS